MINKFIKKPVVIEAIQWTGKNLEEISSMGAKELRQDFLSDDLIISTLEGEMTGSVDDWIIKGIKGEFYPCKPDVFEATYEKVD